MTKNEVSLIILKVTANGQSAVNMKVYKDGTTCRDGIGGLPQIGISAMSHFGDARFFDALMEDIPEQILEKPMMYEEETPNGALEYVVAFYGASQNGETGEQAQWEKSTGIRVNLDLQSDFRDPIMGLLDSLVVKAVTITNEWYFDVMVRARYQALASTLPVQTLMALPKTAKEIHADFENYIQQMLQNAQRWPMHHFADDKTYEMNGKTCRGVIKQDEQSFSIHFIPSGENQDANQANTKPWWKIW